MAHWALRTHKMARSAWRWCIVALRAQWGSRRYTMAQPICHSCIMHIVAPVGHWGSLWTQNIRKWIDPDVAHTVFDFYAGPSARGRQLYCGACNFKNVSAGNLYTCYVESNGLPLLMDTGATRFYSKDIHLVMIQPNTSHRCVPL